MSCLLLIALIAVDFAGTWSGKVITDKEQSVSMTLSQDGNKITGTFGGVGQAQWAITKAAVDGEMLTVEAEPGSIFRFALKIDGDKLIGDAFKDERRIGTVIFERVKQ
jgi:hypothetical protein